MNWELVEEETSRVLTKVEIELIIQCHVDDLLLLLNGDSKLGNTFMVKK